MRRCRRADPSPGRRLALRAADAYAGKVILDDVSAGRGAPLAVSVQRSTPADRPRLEALLFDDPSYEAVALAGGARRAIRLGRLLFGAGIGRGGGEEAFLAVHDGAALGALVAHRGRSSAPAPPACLAAGALAVAAATPPAAWPGLAASALTRARLTFPLAAGGYHVAQLYVLPAVRNRGVGSRLLAHAVARARALGCDAVSLSTAIGNPARRLYARAGFTVAARRTVAGYAGLTATPGHLLLTCRLR